MTISRITANLAWISILTFGTGSFVQRPTTHAKRTIVVRMLGDASGFRFRPASVTAHVGDIVRFVNVSGGPHNVSFSEDGIPAGAAATLQQNMQSTTGELNGTMLSNPNETYTVSLAGLPPGTYQYYCLPHQAMKMVGRITVRR